MVLNFAEGYKKSENLTLTLPGGRIIDCAMPTVTDIRKVSKFNVNSVDDTIELVTYILNLNSNGENITKTEVESWGIDVIYGISEGWVDWINTLRKN